MKFLSLSPKAILAVIFNKILDWFQQYIPSKSHQVVYAEIRHAKKQPALREPN